MKHKVIETGPKARNRVFLGMEKLTDALKIAIGPYGFNMISGVRGGTPHVTNDAQEIASHFSRKDEIEDLGVRHLREAINKANDFAGNGRKSCAILTQAIAKDVIKLLPTEKIAVGKKPLRKVIKQVEDETKHALELLKGQMKPVTSEEQLINIATTASGDETLGEIIGKTQWQLGKEGSIVAEESNDLTSSVEFVQGIKIDNGFGTSVMINNLEKGSFDISNAHILLTNHVMQGSFDAIRPLIESLHRSGVRKLVIIARAFDEKTLKECTAYQQAGHGIYAINAPYTNQNQVMLDIAAISGAVYINTEERDLTDIQISDIGFVKKIQATRWTTVLTGPDTDKIKEKVAKRIETLTQELSGEKSAFARNHIEERLSQLRSGFAILKIGALSSGNRKYKMDKAEDAIKTTKAAIQEGMVPGGGKALKVVSDQMPEDSIIKKALCAPYEQIMANAGEEFEIPDTVQDAYKVVRVGLEYASNIAADAATFGIAINHENEKPRFVQEATTPSEESNV